MRQPIPGDLVSIDKPISAVLIGGNLGKDNNWSYALISIDPEHNGLILEVYNPKNLSNKSVSKAADELLVEQRKRWKKDEKYSPEEITIIVMTIGTNIVEAVYDSNYMTILNI